MLKEKLIELFKERYFFEIDRHDKIRNYIALPMTFLGLELAGIAFVIQKIKILDSDIISIIIYLVFCALILSIMATLFFLYRTLFEKNYGFIPSPKSTLKDIEELKKYYNSHPKFKKLSSKKIEELIENDIENYFYEYYIEAADQNTITNINRSYNLNKSLLLAWISLTLLLVGLLLFIFKYHSYVHKNEVKKNSAMQYLIYKDSKEV